ncbi:MULTISPECIES: aa3-type cytochrome c oxidase subunit IV [unclassified Paracoccus (in: a-proteobacteria)]|uniref:aa3-type cytochrome c oxidase subunit IV n=1 Tax=unclassified Paracoccus (in: a-proteobacteria) TaxID=2688777 RepID=UPI00160392C0|nr:MULTISPECIES: aa3-type cytochrome c oxidase subunit IV [unclassified Paracoccus (in: a-proteobacteria)]MBB1492552.1 aa3-type cytochrome c oxidase subunit IV [Paracoccus sp. MC1854]MBB1498376.1 aa3-type cytochrome c oxidase subunit IV [Paracoccus sp. MC1862]QQO44415.1 aa3-type cytochrome c oxidase subunit IV [Paracoccus sp. MC1862]
MATTHSQNSADRHAEGHHTHGTMEIATQERTFNGFIRLATWSAVAVIAILIFLALSNA